MDMRYIYDIKFGMLQVRENEIQLRKWSSGTSGVARGGPRAPGGTLRGVALR